MKYSFTTLLTCVGTVLVSACSSDSSGGLRLSEISSTLSTGQTEVSTFSFADNGDLLNATFQRDGQEFLAASFETADDGTLLRRSNDLDQDGAEDQAELYEYIEGLGLGRVHTVNADGLIDTVEIFSFENALVFSSNIIDINDVATVDQVELGGGSMQSRSLYTYSGTRLDTIQTDADGNGFFDTEESFTYNNDGTLASSILRSFSGAELSTSTYTYEVGPCNPAAGNSTTAHFCIRS